MSSFYWKQTLFLSWSSGLRFVWFRFCSFSFSCFLISRFSFLLWSHSSKRVSLPQVYWTEKKQNNNNHVLFFFFIIPHSYTVSVWKAAGTRHRAGRKWELGILLGRRQERFDPRVSGQESFLSVSKVTRLPFDSGSLLMIEDNTEGLLYPMPDTQQAQTVG